MIILTHQCTFMFSSPSFRVAGDLSEPGLCSSEKESDLHSSHQRRENPGGGDPHLERAALQEERLSVHSPIHFSGAGEGALTLQKKVLAL